MLSSIRQEVQTNSSNYLVLLSLCRIVSLKKGAPDFPAPPQSVEKGVVAEWKFCSDSSFYVETRLQTAFVWKTRAISV